MLTTHAPKVLFALTLLAQATACGPKLSAVGTHVQVAETAQAPLCRPIGNVEGEGSNHEKAEITLRNRAGELNANTVVITEHAMTPGEVKLVGQAYGCAANNNPSAASPNTVTAPVIAVPPVVVPAP